MLRDPLLQPDLFEASPSHSKAPTPITRQRSKGAVKRLISVRALKVHPLADLMLACSDEEQQALIADIHMHGIIEPPVLLDGIVLDGRARLEAACRLKSDQIRFRDFEEISGDKATALDYLISKNAVRRHLSTSQRAICLAQVILSLEDKSANLHSDQPYDRNQLVKLFSVSRRSLFYALKVAQYGDAQLIAAVKSGALAVSAAAAQLQLRSESEQLGTPLSAEFNFSKPDQKFLNQVESLGRTSTSGTLASYLNSAPQEAIRIREALLLLADSILEVVTPPSRTNTKASCVVVPSSHGENATIEQASRASAITS